MTYILLMLTAVLWGGIIYRIVSYTKNDLPMRKESIKDTLALSTDTLDFFLKLDYRNPFGDIDKKRVITETKKSTQKVITKPKLEPPSFKYKGVIRNNRKIYAMVEVQELVETISKYEIVDGYKILSINADSLIVEKQGKKYSLKTE